MLRIQPAEARFSPLSPIHLPQITPFPEARVPAALRAHSTMGWVRYALFALLLLLGKDALGAVDMHPLLGIGRVVNGQQLIGLDVPRWLIVFGEKLCTHDVGWLQLYLKMWGSPWDDRRRGLSSS